MGKTHGAGALAELARFIAGYSRGPWSRTVPPPSTAVLPPAWPCALRGSSSTPTQEQINRRAYELWQQAGFPSGRDEELAHQAEHELLKGQMRKYLTRGATP
jgi:hypothetical protein